MNQKRPGVYEYKAARDNSLLLEQDCAMASYFILFYLFVYLLALNCTSIGLHIFLILK